MQPNDPNNRNTDYREYRPGELDDNIETSYSADANLTGNGQYTYNPNYDPSYSADAGKGKATAALVLGIVSLVMAWMGWFSILGFILAIVGIVLANSARKTMPYGTAGRATTGMVLCIIAIIISIAAFFISLFFLNSYGGYWDYYNYYWY